MSRKALGILIVVTGILVALAFVGQGRVGTDSIAGDSAGTALLPGLTDDLNGLEQIWLDGAGRQRLVSLERVDDGWIVADVGGYPAERARINALLIAFAEARIVEEKTANPESHALLGVEAVENADAAGLELTLVAANGNRYQIVLGSSYGSGQLYARISERDLSVLIDRNPELPRDPSDWVATDIIDIANDRVQRVEIAHSNGELLVISKASRDSSDFDVANVPDDRELQYAAIANVTGGVLQSLQLDDVERRAEEQTEPVTVSEFWTFDGLAVTVTAAGENEDSWLSFSARFDVEQALQFANESVSDGLSAPEASAVNDAIAEAEAINLRLAEWQYRIPSYQLSQLTRRMQDLLLPEADE